MGVVDEAFLGSTVLCSLSATGHVDQKEGQWVALKHKIEDDVPRKQA